ncbi:uncharacterized protein Tco025E_06156, partial [Trypanosoma conorhini]
TSTLVKVYGDDSCEWSGKSRLSSRPAPPSDMGQCTTSTRAEPPFSKPRNARSMARPASHAVSVPLKESQHASTRSHEYCFVDEDIEISYRTRNHLCFTG